MPIKLIKLSIVLIAIVVIVYYVFMPKPAVKVDVSKFAIADAFQVNPDVQQKKIFVFEQPNCSYCEELALELAKLSDTKVFVFMLAASGEDNKAIASNVWCSANRLQAWKDMLARQPVAHVSCDSSAIDRNLLLAKSIGLKGVPTVIFPSGEIVTGFIKAADIERKLNSPDVRR